MSKELELTLTGKNCGTGGARTDVRHPVPCGGGIFEQAGGKRTTRLPSASRWKIRSWQRDWSKREVIRIVTPGTNLDAQALDEIQEQLYYVHRLSWRTATAFPLRTSQPATIYVTEVDTERKLLDEITKFSPSEIICNEVLLYERCGYRGFESIDSGSAIYALEDWYFDDDQLQRRTLLEHFKVKSWKALGLDGL